MASASRSTAGLNVRPQVFLGATLPVEWSAMDPGQMLGIGLELERSARWSHVAEFEMHWLDANPPESYLHGNGQPIDAWSHAHVISGQVGMRMHLATASRIRPYVQAGLGIRSASSGTEYSTPWYRLDGNDAVYVDGPTAHVRAGLTTARFRGAGLFVDAGVEALLGNLTEFVVAPIRVGVTLP